MAPLVAALRVKEIVAQDRASEHEKKESPAGTPGGARAQGDRRSVSG
jgi:hypothetical protein